MNFLEKSHSGKNQWYLYLLTLLIVFTATQIGSIPLAIYMIWQDPSIMQTGNISTVTSTNMGLALMLLSFVVGFFAILLCAKFIHHKNPVDIITGREHIDWKRFFFGFATWGILSIATFAFTFLTGDVQDIVFQFKPSDFFIMLLIALLLFPFQTSFEEIVFRGYLMQGSFLLFKNKWIAVIFTSILFGAMHGANPEVEEFGIWIAMPQYILMGFILGFVAVQDNGMELSLGIHAANNIISAITFTSDASTLQTHALFKDLSPSASAWDIVYIAIAGIIFIWVCNRKYRFLYQHNISK